MSLRRELGIDPAPSIEIRIDVGIGCMLCPRKTVARGKLICTRCETEYAPTPLRAWRTAIGVTLREIEEGTGLNKRTVLRADAGERMSRDAAEALALFTGLKVRVFRPRKES